MKSLRNIFAPALLLAALIFASACNGHGEESGEGTGDIILKLSNPVELQTRHADGEGSDASDGGIMKTLRVWLISSDNVILNYVDVNPNAATQTVKFEKIARGTYHICAVANYNGLNSAKSLVNDYKIGDDIDSDFTAAIAGTITDGSSPIFDDGNGMPSSLLMQNVDIAAGENIIEASLLRVVGRLTINVRNNLDAYELFVHSIGLSKQNQTKGLVFVTDGNRLPSDSKAVNFPDLPTMDRDGDGELDGLVQVGPRAVKNIYDIYLYETATDIDLTFDMLAALYDKGTEKSAVTVTEGTAASLNLYDNASDYDSNGEYLIRSASSSTYYLADDGSGNLVAKEFTDDSEIKGKTYDEIKNYLWKFSSSPSTGGGGGGTKSTTYIQNVGTQKYIYLTTSGVSLSTSRVTMSNRVNDSGLYFYVSSGKSSRSYLALSSNAPASVSGSYYYWKVRQVEEIEGSGAGTYTFVGASASIPRNKRTIRYIDNYGASQPLTQINRNEHVTVNINVFYNREIGQFDFEVEDWDDGGSHETTFD